MGKDRRAAAADVVGAYRAAALELDPKMLSPREAVIGFAIATKLKNLADRRATALRKPVDAIFTGENALSAEDRALVHAEGVLFDGEATAAGDVVAVKITNGSFGQKTLSEAKAFDLLKTKKPSAKRSVMEKPPRPPQPPSRFSPEKFRKLIEGGVITQSEYDACLEPSPPRPTMTIDVPVEIEEAITKMALQPPPPPPDAE